MLHILALKILIHLDALIEWTSRITGHL